MPRSTGSVDRPLRVALEVWSADFSQVVDTCVRAERSGFDAFYYGEAPTGLNLDCWTTLAALAERTSIIRLGPVIANVLDTYRSPALLGKQAATVAIISGGRLDFRTGVGAAVAYGRRWWEPYGVSYGVYDDRLAELRRTVGLLRPFWAGEPVEFSHGEAVTIGFDSPSIPVTIAATGPKGMRLARELADTWETSFRTAAEFTAQRQQFGNASTVTASLEVDAFVGTAASAVDRVLRRARAERGSEDLEAVFERALVGTPDVVADQLGALKTAGVHQVVVALHDPHDPDALEALADAAGRGR